MRTDWCDMSCRKQNRTQALRHTEETLLDVMLCRGGTEKGWRQVGHLYTDKLHGTDLKMAWTHQRIFTCARSLSEVLDFITCSFKYREDKPNKYTGLLIWTVETLVTPSGETSSLLQWIQQKMLSCSCGNVSQERGCSGSSFWFCQIWMKPN